MWVVSRTNNQPQMLDVERSHNVGDDVRNNVEDEVAGSVENHDLRNLIVS